jgi:hypothetical protein
MRSDGGSWRILAHHIKKRPFYLNMMRVTVIEKPSSEERVMVTRARKPAAMCRASNA